MTFKLVFLPPQTDVYREWGRKLARILPEITVIVAENDGAAAEAISDADGAVGMLPADLLKRARKLRWLQSHHAAPPAGYYHADLVAHPVTVTNMREIFDDHIGAHIMAFLLSFARGLHYYIPHQLRRQWAPRPVDSGMVHLPESTLLIVGVGGIGAETARLAAAFGMKVIGTDARRAVAPPGVTELHPADSLDALLPRADFVVLTCPLTEETRGVIDARALALLPPGACLVNVARGPCVVEADLIAELRSGRLGGAALDCTDPEPPAADSPLWGMANVLMTPHTAGETRQYEANVIGILRENLDRLWRGEAALRNGVV